MFFGSTSHHCQVQAKEQMSSQCGSLGECGFWSLPSLGTLMGDEVGAEDKALSTVKAVTRLPLLVGLLV